jgi:glycosyltransferase involved in cell wall biosynthesis
LLKISVIIPSYNQGNFLEETILSVTSQGYPNLELFVIDGGSKDNTIEIIKKYENQLTGWISEKDSGQSDAINKGLEMCTGDILSWLCSDDLYTPGSLFKVDEVFSSLPQQTGVIHGNSEIFKKNKVINYDTGYINWPEERQFAGMTFPQPSSFMRRSILQKAGKLNTKLHFGMDYELFSRMKMISDFHYVDFLFSRYRLHDESKSTTSIAKFIDEWILIFNSIVDGLEIESIKKSLKDLKLKTPPDESTMSFFRKHKSEKNPDPDKMLFYFLVNVIRYDYITEKFDRVKTAGSFVKNNYMDLLKTEPAVVKILKRAQILHPSLLRVVRNVKRSLTKE